MRSKDIWCPYGHAGSKPEPFLAKKGLRFIPKKAFTNAFREQMKILPSAPFIFPRGRYVKGYDSPHIPYSKG
jgi:hypothetical protein